MWVFAAPQWVNISRRCQTKASSKKAWMSKAHPTFLIHVRYVQATRGAFLALYPDLLPFVSDPRAGRGLSCPWPGPAQS